MKLIALTIMFIGCSLLAYLWVDVAGAQIGTGAYVCAAIFVLLYSGLSGWSLLTFFFAFVKHGGSSVDTMVVIQVPVPPHTTTLRSVA